MTILDYGGGGGYEHGEKVSEGGFSCKGFRLLDTGKSPLPSIVEGLFLLDTADF